MADKHLAKNYFSSERKDMKFLKGFTLVELMIVVVIMGILVAVAIPIYSSVTANTERKACYSNGEVIEKAAIQYMMNTGADDVTGIFIAGGTSVTIVDQADAEAKLSPEYLKCFDGGEFPVCPSAGQYTLSIDATNDSRSITASCSEHGTRFD